MRYIEEFAHKWRAQHDSRRFQAPRAALLVVVNQLAENHGRDRRGLAQVDNHARIAHAHLEHGANLAGAIDVQVAIQNDKASALMNVRMSHVAYRTVRTLGSPGPVRLASLGE